MEEIRMEEMTEMPKFESEAEVFDWVMSEMLPDAEGDELGEEALDMVAGGMSSSQAWKVLSNAYWELHVRRRPIRNFDTKDLGEIREALKVCEKYIKKYGKQGKIIINAIKAIGKGIL